MVSASAGKVLSIEAAPVLARHCHYSPVNLLFFFSRLIASQLKHIKIMSWVDNVSLFVAQLLFWHDASSAPHPGSINLFFFFYPVVQTSCGTNWLCWLFLIDTISCRASSSFSFVLVDRPSYQTASFLWVYHKSTTLHTEAWMHRHILEVVEDIVSSRDPRLYVPSPFIDLLTLYLVWSSTNLTNTVGHSRLHRGQTTNTLRKDLMVWMVLNEVGLGGSSDGSYSIITKQ